MTVVAINKDVCGGLANACENGRREDCVQEGLVLRCLVQHLEDVVINIETQRNVMPQIQHMDVVI